MSQDGYEIEVQKRKEQIAARIERRRQRDASDLAHVLKSPQGRRILWNLMVHAGVHMNAFSEADTDRTTHFKLGKQYMGQSIEADIRKHCPGLLDQMRKEAESDELRGQQ